MTRAFDDQTSTCGTCMYFAPGAPDGGPADGHCGWLSLPAYVYRNSPQFSTLMRADAGKDCWLHTKRQEMSIDAQALLKRVAARSRNVCLLCGDEHNMMPCGSTASGETGK